MVTADPLHNEVPKLLNGTFATQPGHCAQVRFRPIADIACEVDGTAPVRTQGVLEVDYFPIPPNTAQP